MKPYLSGIVETVEMAALVACSELELVSSSETSILAAEEPGGSAGTSADMVSFSRAQERRVEGDGGGTTEMWENVSQR